MPKKPGQAFEDLLELSCPEGTMLYRFNTPAPAARLVNYLAARCRSGGLSLDVWALRALKDSSRFTKAPPFDYVLTAGPSKNRIVLPLELKTTQEARLDDDAVTDEQINSLIRARDAGDEGGFLIEFRGRGQDGQAVVVYLSITNYLAWRTRADRKSMPMDEVVTRGIPVLFLPLTGRQQIERLDIAGLLRQLRR